MVNLYQWLVVCSESMSWLIAVWGGCLWFFETLARSLRFADQTQEATMLYWALVFLVIALIAGALGFGGIAGAAGSIAHIIFYVFLVLLLVSLIMHFARGSAP